MDTPRTHELIEHIRRCNRPLAPVPTGHPTDPAPPGEIHAVIFDIYGTLLVSGSGDVGTANEERSDNAVERALWHTGLLSPGQAPAGDGEEILLRTIRGHHEAARAGGVEYPEVDILAVWRDVSRDLGLKEVPERMLEHLAIEHECLTNPVWPMPGMVQMLGDLFRHGVRLGIASNAQFYTPLTLEALTGAGPEALGFTPAFCAWSWQLGEAKPSPRLFEDVRAALEEHHGIAAGQALYVGNDMLKDIWPASRAGFRTALFAGDRRSLRLREGDERVAGVRPDAVIDDLRQIPGLVLKT